MKQLIVFIFLLIWFNCAMHAAPIEDKKNTDNKEAKSVFGPAFDEIVVESHLTVRRKTDGRQGRTQNTTIGTTETVKSKRNVKSQVHNFANKNGFTSEKLRNFEISSTNSQAQSFNYFGPLGSFGASADINQAQGVQFGPNNFKVEAGFTGKQQYIINGQIVDIDFDSRRNGNSVSVIVTKLDEKKKQLT